MKYLITLLLLLPLSAHAAETYNPEGLWLTENNRAAIRVEVEKDNTLVGYVAWIIEGGLEFDEFNPDITQRDQPMCGLEIMKDLKPVQGNANRWQDGFIYKADDGDVYNVNVEILSDDKIKVRGYKGITLLGKTQHWKRVSSKDYPKCKPAKK